MHLHVQRLADALESAGKAMEELGTGAQTEATLRHSQQFLEAVRVSQKTLQGQYSTVHPLAFSLYHCPGVC